MKKYLNYIFTILLAYEALNIQSVSSNTVNENDQEEEETAPENEVEFDNPWDPSA
jgi:hypothetical protein